MTQEKKEFPPRILATLEAMATIKGLPDVGNPITCPLCGSELQWIKAGKHKHVHARCKTEGCLSFGE